MLNKHENKTAKTFIGELYEEDSSMQYAIGFLFNCPYSCVYIWHDKDIYEDGTPKKKHLHFVLRMPYKTCISVVAKELQINACYIDTCASESKSLLYLIHRGWSEKYQYDPDEAKGNGVLFTRFNTLTEDESEDDRVMRIIKMLEDIERPIQMREFIKMCCEAGIYTELRRGGYLLVQALKEHNEQYAQHFTEG